MPGGGARVELGEVRLAVAVEVVAEVRLDPVGVAGRVVGRVVSVDARRRRDGRGGGQVLGRVERDGAGDGNVTLPPTARSSVSLTSPLPDVLLTLEFGVAVAVQVTPVRPAGRSTTTPAPLTGAVPVFETTTVYVTVRLRTATSRLSVIVTPRSTPAGRQVLDLLELTGW